MLSFRQKILLGLAAFFVAISVILIPVTLFLSSAVHESMLLRQTHALVKKLERVSAPQEMAGYLEAHQEKFFMNVALFDSAKGALFSYPPSAEHEITPAIFIALKEGKSIEKHYSSFYEQEMLYTAIAFESRGKRYVLRMGLPYSLLQHTQRAWNVVVLSLSLGSLLLFGLCTALLLQIFTRSINQILNAIKSYRVAKEEFIPHFQLSKVAEQKDEFGQLAETLNALSTKIEHQISSLTQEKNNKAAILESLGEGVIAVDHAMTVIYINRMAEVLLDVKKKELLGKNFILSKKEKCHQLIHEAQEKNETAVAVLQVDKKPKRYIDAIAVPRGKEGAILVLQDKTSLHKVIELGKDFIANASHELKTPITIIRGFAETLHDHPEISHEVYSEITAKIVSNCERMEKLVRNLLTLAAVDEGLPRSRLHECDLLDLVEQARQTILTVHPVAEIEVEVREEIPYLLLDGDLIMQAVLNLIDNAVKYSKPPAQVRVVLEKGNHTVTIAVHDRGVGIPPEDLERIFERFYAVDKSHSRSLGGSGLGLSIVERIIEKHRGSIDVASEVGKGSTFTLILPVVEEEKY